MNKINENTEAALTYLVGFFTGIFFLLVEKKSPFIRFHAWQSTITFGLLLVIYIILGFLPIFGAFLANLLDLVGLVLWLFLMWKAYQGEQYHLPYLGNLAEKQLKKE